MHRIYTDAVRWLHQIPVALSTSRHHLLELLLGKFHLNQWILTLVCEFIERDHFFFVAMITTTSVTINTQRIARSTWKSCCKNPATTSGDLRASSGHKSNTAVPCIVPIQNEQWRCLYAASGPTKLYSSPTANSYRMLVFSSIQNALLSAISSLFLSFILSHLAFCPPGAVAGGQPYRAEPVDCDAEDGVYRAETGRVVERQPQIA